MAWQKIKTYDCICMYAGIRLTRNKTLSRNPHLLTSFRDLILYHYKGGIVNNFRSAVSKAYYGVKESQYVMLFNHSGSESDSESSGGSQALNVKYES